MNLRLTDAEARHPNGMKTRHNESYIRGTAIRNIKFLDPNVLKSYLKTKNPVPKDGCVTTDTAKTSSSVERNKVSE